MLQLRETMCAYDHTLGIMLFPMDDFGEVSWFSPQQDWANGYFTFGTLYE